jgi:hypothetical protein
MITLQDISNAVNEKLSLEEKIFDYEEKIKELNKLLTVIEEETIPCAFQELGIQEIKLDNGQKVKVVLDVYSSLSNENKPRAYAWLNAHNYGGLIKVELSINYSKGEKQKAEEKYKELIKDGLSVDLTEGVHHSTLSSFLRERVREGAEVPLDLFGARPVFKTKISKK